MHTWPHPIGTRVSHAPSYPILIDFATWHTNIRWSCSGHVLVRMLRWPSLERNARKLLLCEAWDCKKTNMPLPCNQYFFFYKKKEKTPVLVSYFSVQSTTCNDPNVMGVVQNHERWVPSSCMNRPHSIYLLPYSDITLLTDFLLNFKCFLMCLCDKRVLLERKVVLTLSTIEWFILYCDIIFF